MDLKKQDELLKELREKYPNAETDEFERYCMTWEFIQGGKGSWFVICVDGSVNDKMQALQPLFDQESAMKGGIALQAFSDKPNAQPTAFQVVCYEDAMDDVKGKLQQIGIEDSQMEWSSEEEMSKQYADWKSKQSPRQS